MRNILYIANARIPTEKAHGLQIINMCESFANSGVQVKLILPTRINKNYKDSNPFDFYSVKNNFEILKLKSIDPTFVLKITKGGVYIKIQSFFFAISLFFYLLFNKIDGYTLYTRESYLLPLLQFFSKNVVLEIHDIPSKASFYLKYWKNCQKIITISQGLKNKLIELGVDKDKIYNAPDGVKLEKFDINDDKVEARKKLNLPVDKKIIIYTGHLYDWKGTQVLADASKFLNNNSLIIFIGGTSQDIKNFKEKNKDLKNVSILGRKDHGQIPLFLKASDVLVLPNSAKKEISSLYTSPIKLFEYMASKRPIVASSLPSIKEILNDSNSVLVSPDSPESLAQGLSKILSDEVFSNSISTKSFDQVRNYTWKKRAENILNFIN